VQFMVIIIMHNLVVIIHLAYEQQSHSVAATISKRKRCVFVKCCNRPDATHPTQKNLLRFVPRINFVLLNSFGTLCINS
jgi:hypothetical protein